VARDVGLVLAIDHVYEPVPPDAAMLLLVYVLPPYAYVGEIELVEIPSDALIVTVIDSDPEWLLLLVSVAVALKVADPAFTPPLVPVTVPFEFNVKPTPVRLVVPLLSVDHVKLLLPPDAASCVLYAVPNTPVGSGVGVVTVIVR
jgi:hypothetical protein